jgi:RNA polymerase sigma-70 factor (ECF subfamily)
MERNALDISFPTGGEAELEALIGAYGQPLLRYCHNILCNYHEAQDALQLTFIKAYKKRATFESGKALSPWLYRIAYATCIDILRKNRLRLLPTTLIAAPDATIPEDIRDALFTLSPQERAIIYGRVMEERSYDELSSIYGPSAATLRKRYERARKKLQAQLKEEYSYYAKPEEAK